jgi:hypothetical protein
MQSLISIRTSILGRWFLLTLASTLAGLVGVFCAYISSGYPLSAAIGFAWPMSLISGGMGALVIPGPLLTLWSAWEIFVMDAPNDLNGLAFLVSLPSTLALATLTRSSYVAAGPERSRRIRFMTLILPAMAYTAVAVAGGWLSAP